MPLTLVTGPANSAKAQVVLDAYVAALPREPLLIVPRAADAEQYRRELADRGVVFGARVERFAGLLRELARRAGIRRRVLGEHARSRVAEAAIGSVRLEALAASSRTPGFAAACLSLIEQLEERRVDPARLRVALRRWSEDGGPPRAWGEEVAAIYSAYRDRLERLGALDEQLAGWRALDAVRLDPGAWGGTPVFLYGFDDLEPLQRDAVETLAVNVGAAVTLSLPYEAGRLALAGRARTFEELRPLADEHVVLPGAGDYYEEPALHALERAMFEPEPRPPIDPGTALTLLEAPSPHAERRGVARTVATLIADEGFEPGDIAVVTRAGPVEALALERALRDADVPCVPFVRPRFADTGPGRGLLCALRCALLDGGAEDLVGYLRTPGLLERPWLADDLEARARRGGVTDAAQARELWRGFELDGIDRIAAAGRRPLALIDAVAAELERLFAAPWRRRAAILGPREHAEALAVGAARRALEELRALALAEPRLGPSARELHAALAAVEAQPPPGEGVQVCDPLSLRARRVRALVVCGLQSGSFPRAERQDPFFGGEERAALARASGLLLGAPEDALSAERYLFYATISRPTARLVLSWHVAGDDGEPAQRSLFVHDVLELFDGARVDRLAEERDAAARHRAAAVAPLSAATLGERPLSPSSLERWTECPVRWLVERELRAEPLEPAAEPLARGRLAHGALQQVFERVRSELGSARLDDPRRLERARELLAAALAELEEQEGPVSVDPLRARVELRRLHADLERYLERWATSGSQLEPAHFELAFGLEEGGRPAVELAGGELRLRGRVDRVDLDESGRVAVVRDYKASASHPAARWVEERRLQVALYMLVVEQLLGVEVAGGFYQALRGKLEGRGVLREDVDPQLCCAGTDRRSEEELEQLLEATLGLALQAGRELREGRLEARPETCGGRGVCAFPALCRSRP